MRCGGSCALRLSAGACGRWWWWWWLAVVVVVGVGWLAVVAVVMVGGGGAAVGGGVLLSRRFYRFSDVLPQRQPPHLPQHEGQRC